MTQDHSGQDEAALEPDLPIVDAHHHLWRQNHQLAAYALDYMAEELVADAQGHNVVATVYMECHCGYRTDGPEAMRPVGETEFAVAAGGLHGGTDVGAGIISYADLMLGEAVGPVLDAHIDAGQGRFRGVRNRVTFCDDPGVPAMYNSAPPGRLAEPAMRAGGRELAKRGLVFDTWMFQPQLGELADFAAAAPDLSIVLNHVGGFLGMGRFADHPKETFDQWRSGLVQVASQPNVTMKIGGMGMNMISPGLVAQGGGSTNEMVTAWTPLFDTCVEVFGADRCMLESNFPVDRLGGSYRRFWNAFKRMASGASAAEKTALFSGTAARVYGLTL
jgi:L-fuconolactonase